MSADAHPTHRAETSEQPLTSEQLTSHRRTAEQATPETVTNEQSRMKRQPHGHRTDGGLTDDGLIGDEPAAGGQSGGRFTDDDLTALHPSDASTNRATTDLTTELQLAVREYLIRHRSIMDTMSKLQEASARVNRAVAKAVTVCGCVEVQARRQQVPKEASEDITYVELKRYVQTHLSGDVCDQCRDVLEAELGQTFFYATALCETLNLRASNIVNRELQRVVTLGVFNLT